MKPKMWLGGGLPLLVGLLLAVVLTQSSLPNPVLYLRLSLSTPVLFTGLLTTLLLTGALWWHFRQAARLAQQKADLRAAAELVGVLARDHVIVAAGGYFSFVEAGRWRR